MWTKKNLGWSWKLPLHYRGCRIYQGKGTYYTVNQVWPLLPSMIRQGAFCVGGGLNGPFKRAMCPFPHVPIFKALPSRSGLQHRIYTRMYICKCCIGSNVRTWLEARRAWDLWCLCKLTYSEGENTMHWITTCMWLFLDDLTMEIESETLNSYGGGDWTLTQQEACWSSFVHDGWGFLLASNWLNVNPSPLDCFVILDVISIDFTFV